MSTLLLTLLLSIPVDVQGARAATLYRPAGGGPFPTVLLVEGWWAEADSRRSMVEVTASWEGEWD